MNDATTRQSSEKHTSTLLLSGSRYATTPFFLPDSRLHAIFRTIRCLFHLCLISQIPALCTPSRCTFPKTSRAMSSSRPCSSHLKITSRFGLMGATVRLEARIKPSIFFQGHSSIYRSKASGTDTHFPPFQFLALHIAFRHLYYLSTRASTFRLHCSHYSKIRLKLHLLRRCPAQFGENVHLLFSIHSLTHSFCKQYKLPFPFLAVSILQTRLRSAQMLLAKRRALIGHTYEKSTSV